MAAGVVPDGGADVLGDRVDLAQQLFERLAVQLGVFVQSDVEVC